MKKKKMKEKKKWGRESGISGEHEPRFHPWELRVKHDQKNKKESLFEKKYTKF